MSILYLSRADVERVGLGPREILDAVRAAFVEKGHGRVEMPPKPGIHPGGDAFIHAMPALIPALDAAGLKWVSGYPDNAARGLPYIGGVLVLNDPATGLVRMIADCTWITAVRTAAATALAVSCLARVGASRVALLGLGVQGRSHLDALPFVMPELAEVRAYDVDASQAERFATYASGAAFGVIVTRTPREAVEGADVIVTAGPILKSPEPTIPLEWIAPGALICPVDFDAYVAADVLLEADRFYSDDLRQLDYYRWQGYFANLPDDRRELADVVVGRDAGRTSDDARIVVMNLGIALEDMAVAARVFAHARAEGIGTELPL